MEEKTVAEAQLWAARRVAWRDAEVRVGLACEFTWRRARDQARSAPAGYAWSVEQTKEQTKGCTELVQSNTIKETAESPPERSPGHLAKVVSSINSPLSTSLSIFPSSRRLGMMALASSACQWITAVGRSHTGVWETQKRGHGQGAIGIHRADGKHVQPRTTVVRTVSKRTRPQRGVPTAADGMIGESPKRSYVSHASHSNATRGTAAPA